MPTITGFHYHDGELIQEPILIKASTAVKPGCPLKRTATAQTWEPATTNEAVGYVLSDKEKVSTDSDYASNTYRMATKVLPSTQFRCGAGSGTFASTDVQCDLTSVSSGQVNAAADTASNNDLYIDKILSTASAVVRFMIRVGE